MNTPHLIYWFRHKHTGTLLLVLGLLFGGSVTPGLARTSNGNDFALYFSEAKTTQERKTLFEDAKGRPHFFRYLQIMEMDEVTQDGRTVVQVVAFEPASLMDVVFTVYRSLSLQKLKDEPVTQKGDAIAVTGKLISIDPKQNRIKLEGVIVRHKDKLSPARGKELLCEVKPGATFYSYTGGRQEVNLTFRDRDLLRFKDKILKQRGPQGWADFLESELAKRNRTHATGKAGSKP